MTECGIWITDKDIYNMHINPSLKERSVTSSGELVCCKLLNIQHPIPRTTAAFVIRQNLCSPSSARLAYLDYQKILIAPLMLFTFSNQDIHQHCVQLLVSRSTLNGSAVTFWSLL